MNRNKHDPNEEIRKFASTIEQSLLPKETVYVVMAARPISDTEAVTDPIAGYYHAQYVRDRISDEMGHAGVSFYLKELDVDPSDLREITLHGDDGFHSLRNVINVERRGDDIHVERYEGQDIVSELYNGASIIPTSGPHKRPTEEDIVSDQ